ncbi:hypothetical protein FOZ60_001065 [Perkinsus olseni]|uniref:Uncharacterized protein n=1 Tax=Perkinsus olseni TaxID=32597 RepID=A0A7J6P175_PEROL|nr:hypothetical protein FOZ60_001065 [Perkinsus olseni]
MCKPFLRPCSTNLVAMQRRAYHTSRRKRYSEITASDGGSTTPYERVHPKSFFETSRREAHGHLLALAHGVEDVGHEGGTEAGNLDGAEYPQRSRLLDPPRADGEALKTEISDGRKRKRGRPGKWGPALKKQYTATKGLPSRGSSTTTPSTPLEPSSSSSPPSIDDYDLPPGVDAHL